MKAKIILGGLVLVGLVGHQALGQEYDDMYFNSKDRAKMRTSQKEVSPNNKIDADYEAFKKKHFGQEEQLINPADSYSARNVNPEFIARANSEVASEDNYDYFVQGYTPYTPSVNQNYNPYYSNNYFWNSPYRANSYMWNNPYAYNPYGYYDSWGYPGYYSYNPYGYGYDPYGYSYFGSNWGYGWNSSWSLYNRNSYYTSCGYYSPYYGSGYGYGYSGYASRTDYRYGSYGKYATRNASYVNYNPATIDNTTTTGRTRSNSYRTSSSGDMSTGGRVSTARSSTTTSQPEYYSPRRRVASSFGQTSGQRSYNTGNSSTNRSSFFNSNSSNSGRGSSLNRSSNSFNSGGSSFTPTRSSSGSSSSGNSSSGSSGSGSSTGRTRGGN